MSFYTTFSTARATTPDPVALRAAVQAATSDATAVVFNLGSGSVWQGKKATAWSAADITATQTALDTTAASTPTLRQQQEIDAIPIAWRAIVLALIDQVNVIRAALPAPLNPITPAQALAAIRAKAGTL